MLGLCDALAGEMAVSQAQAETLRLALRIGRLQVETAPLTALLQLPLATHEGLTGDWRRAVPVAAAVHLLYLGADLLDNVADRELHASWDPWGADQAALTACALLYPLAQRAAAGGAAPTEVRFAVLRALAEAAGEMAGGQQEELRRSLAEDPDPEAAVRAAASKSGAEGAAACSAAALLAGAPPGRAEALSAFGRAYATAVQVASDCQDIWRPDASPDLANARPTAPVLYALWAAPPDEREILRQQILAAGWDARAHAGIRAALAARGALSYCALRVRVLQGQATAALERAGLGDQAFLRLLVDRIWRWDREPPDTRG